VANDEPFASRSDSRLLDTDDDAGQNDADRGTINHRGWIIGRRAIDDRRRAIAAAPAVLMSPITAVISTPVLDMALLRARRNDECPEQENAGDRQSCRQL
jgi:hypothetical protein